MSSFVRLLRLQSRLHLFSHRNGLNDHEGCWRHSSVAIYHFLLVVCSDGVSILCCFLDIQSPLMACPWNLWDVQFTVSVPL